MTVNVVSLIQPYGLIVVHDPPLQIIIESCAVPHDSSVKVFDLGYSAANSVYIFE